ncbi:MAG: acetoacetate--CoA ligase [Deltaproteobacteria bacterium RIFCSPHIGHO2_02_FULL_40_11]|nr:MAG: acetoacetate--CoA ligase [Deltaproteobacteria bacterium RIFCSPHIGHO2_02_FULL_40_11]
MKKPLWKPSQERIEKSNFQKYFSFLKETYDLNFHTYDPLYAWSIKEPSVFWASLWKFFNLKASSYEKAMGEPKMPGTKWFLGAKLNFSENLLRFRDDSLALIALGEARKPQYLTYKELYLKVAQCARALKKVGIQKNDRVCGYLPNIPETVIAMLATNSLGAIWSSCSPDFGVQGVLDRFGQIKPKVLFTVDGYYYNGKKFECQSKVQKIVRQIPSIQKVIEVPYLGKGGTWETFLNGDRSQRDLSPSEIDFVQLPFDHPLYIMFSSGTTGVPKCIVHGQGGTLLQHLKELILHTDLKREDRICYVTTCGWMMWNWLVSSLTVGATVVLSEGSVAYPDLGIRWRDIEAEKITVFGASPKYLSACQKEGIVPKKIAKMPHLKTILSTGAPLTKENFRWVYENIKADLQLSSISGGTDIISCFMLGNPLLPVYEEQIQCLGLGMKVEAFDENGRPVLEEKGELVCSAPFPSMPIGFWDDPEGKKYHEAYFETYPHIWRHGDFITITKEGGVVVYGRSDATLNPGGVRIGTAEIYRQIEKLPEIKDSIVVSQKWKEDVRIILFVVLKEGHVLNQTLGDKIRSSLRENASPRHVPEKILVVKDIPYTMSGKKVELAVQNVIHNEPVRNKSAISNPESLEEFKNREELQS